MLEIDNLKLVNLPNGAHYTFHDNTIQRIKANETMRTKFTKLLTPYDASFQTEDNALKISQKNFLSDEILETDKLRGDILRSLKNTVKGMAMLPIASLAEAAKIVAQNIKDYNIDPKAPMDKETGLVKNLVTDLKEKNAASIATLGLTEVVEQLEAANEKVNQLIEERNNAYATRELGALRNARTKVDDAYRKLMQVINAFILVEGETEYKTFVDQQNESIKRYKLYYLGQKTNKKEDEEEEPTSPTPAITAIYPKEGADPENPLLFRAGTQAIMEFEGFLLKGQDETLEHVIALVEEYGRFTEWIKASAISNVTDTSCEFTMVPDLASGKYTVHIETYDGGSPLVVEFPELITLE